MWNAGLDEAQAGIKISRRNINYFRYADDTTFMTGTKVHLNEGERGKWKSSFKAQYSKGKIMTSSLITPWQTDRETTETVKDFIFLGSKITADVGFSNEIKRHLLLGRKAMTNLDTVLKIRDITLWTKVCLVKATVFLSSSYVWMWELGHRKGWVWKNWCFWTVVLEKTLESPLDCKEIKPVNPKGNQSWTFIGGTDVEAEASILQVPNYKPEKFIFLLNV